MNEKLVFGMFVILAVIAGVLVFMGKGEAGTLFMPLVTGFLGVLMPSPNQQRKEKISVHPPPLEK